MAKIHEYLERINKKNGRYELNKFGEERFESAKDSFVTCCKSVVPDWKDITPSVTEELVRYVVQSDRFKGDLSKGIMLMGATGVGKTVYLKALSLMMGYANQMKFNIYTGFEMERIYMNDIERETYFLSQSMNAKMFGIDDLGEEHTSIKRYGTEINVGIDTITQRHQLFTNKGYLTFATTNLNAEMIGQKYGSRIESRVYEMCNMIGVKGKDLRKS